MRTVSISSLLKVGLSYKPAHISMHIPQRTENRVWRRVDSHLHRGIIPVVICLLKGGC